jgi:hypothetical protein
MNYRSRGRSLFNKLSGVSGYSQPLAIFIVKTFLSDATF